MRNDTICSISTPPGLGGIGIVRISGDEALAMLDAIFRPRRHCRPSESPSHKVLYGHIIDNGSAVEEVLVTIMKRPATYTREDIVEIGCHGGSVTLRSILNLCLRHGARMAEPGEFTRRALENGRIDLAQAESVLEIIHSKTEKSLQLAIKNLQGSLSWEIKSLRKSIVDILVYLEAAINFPEEDTGDEGAEILPRIIEVKAAIEKILSRSGRGKIICRGINAAIVGRTNSGKSSLLNALLREERAIVTSAPGTTRDTIQETVDIRGIPFKIIDTAGIRKGKGIIEEMGINKAMEWMDRAEIVLLVIDLSRGLNKYDKALLENLEGKNYLLVLNKNDRPPGITASEIKGLTDENKTVRISAKNHSGIDVLEKKLYDTVMGESIEPDGTEIYLNIRQEELMEQLKKHLGCAEDSMKNGEGLELAAEHLKSAADGTDRLLGTKIQEDVMDEIFSRFCIGK